MHTCNLAHRRWTTSLRKFKVSYSDFEVDLDYIKTLSKKEKGEAGIKMPTRLRFLSLGL